ncbi:MAG: acyltransferase family protein [Pseudomonadota bacterium]
MKYRREIDGLRAVAVVPVILFHAGFGIFDGGYLGVDVFFVISGYLISSILIEELSEKRFSIIKFYERRARRILPALIFICVLCVPFAAVLMVPTQFEDFGRALVSIAIFISNIHFWRQSGYFGEDAELNPLIHTWSLAVEEQFYVVFPIFLWVIWRFGKRFVFAVILICALISLGMSHWAAENKPMANFFLTPTRVWELFAGAMCALVLHNRVIAASEFLSALGLILIVSSLMMFTKFTPTPSIWTVWPILGVCLIILFCDQRTFVGKILGFSPFVYIGLISYSAYLWHQPVFAFIRIHDPNPGHAVMVAASLLIVPLSYLTWRWVEQPFRSSSKSTRQFTGWKTVFLASTVSLAVVFSSGQFIVSRDGFSSRLTAAQNEILAIRQYEIRDEAYRSGICFMNPESDEPYASECTIDNAAYAIWGDSHAAALSVGFRFVSDRVSQYTGGRCAPILDFDTWDNPRCIERNSIALLEIQKSQPRTVVLMANWSGYLDNRGAKAALATTLEKIVEVNPDGRVVLIGSSPQWHPSLPELYVRRGRELTAPSKFELEGLLLRRLRNFDDVLNQIASENVSVSFSSLLDALCDEDGRCLSAVSNGNRVEPVVWDYGHFTELGSNEAVQRLISNERWAKESVQKSKTDE